MKHSKKLVLLAAAAVLAIAAVGAYAYWTTSGSGSGSATTGTNQAFTITQLGSVTNLVPGGPAQAVDYRVSNPASYNQYLTSVSFVVDPSWSADADGPGGNAPCTAADFALVQSAAHNSDLTPGDHDYSPSGATIAMINSASNQDNCKSVTVPLLFTSN